MSSLIGASDPFDWPRYWRVWSADSHGFDSEGDSSFLLDPEEAGNAWASLGMEAPASADAEPKSLAKLIENKLAIVLLGRPGAGKSTELHRAVRQGLLADEGLPPIVRVGKHLFPNQSPHEFIFNRDDWRDARARKVTLILDGVDEIMQISPRFMGAFQEAFESEMRNRNAEHRVRLVLSCRSAEWRGYGLLRRWPQEQQLIGGLCQLTWHAADNFVRHYLGERTAVFWKEADRLKLAALVVWPHSLDELVRQFKAHRRLPASHFDLIRGASLRRCQISTSWDQDRAARLEVEEDPKWLFRLVGRAAAISVFGGEPAISIEGWELEDAEPWTHPSERDINSSDLELLRRSEHFDVTEDKRLVFQHQIFREHMAAAWLAERKMTAHQLRRLFGQASGDCWSHFPQLATVAAWLAADPSQHEWRNFLIRHDPMVLLRADATNLADTEKKEITRALLERAKRDGHTDPGEAHQSLDSLACDGLAEIVSPFLDDTSPAASVSRGLAIRIVHEAQIKSLVPKLWDFARAEHESQRILIARALRDLADDAYLNEWEEVLAERIPSDDHGTLLGSALDHLIPKHKSVRDALDVVLPPRNFHIMGEITFDGALRRMPSKVRNQDIIPILNRSAQHHATGFSDRWSKHETIVSAAFRLLPARLDAEPFMEAMVEWWIEHCHSHANAPGWKRDEETTTITLDELGMRQESRRRRFLSAFAVRSCKRVTDKDHGTHMAMRVKEFVVLAEDVPWIIHQAQTRSSNETGFWCWFLADAVRDAVKKPELRPLLQDAWDRLPELRERFPASPEGTTIYDHLAAKWKESEAEEKRQNAAIRRRIAKNQEGHAAYNQYHRAIANQEVLDGNPESWTRLTHVVSLTKSPSGGTLELNSVDEIRGGPEWMREAARIYLRHAPPPYPGPSTTHEIISLRCDSTWAFHVLWDELAKDGTIPHELIVQWLPYVFDNMTSSGWHTKGFEIEDVLRAFFPQSMDAYFVMLAHGYEKQDSLYRLKHLQSFWNQHANEMLMAMLMSTPPQPQGFANGLELLSQHDLESAKKVADHWLEKLKPSAEDEAGRTLLTGMITALNGYRWEVIQAVLDQSPESARKVLVHAFGRMDLMHERDARLATFSDDHLEHLVEVMFRTFPPADDPRREGGNVTASDEARFARDAMFGIVQERGLTDVIRRLRSLQLPKTETWLGNALARAKASKNSAGWQPISAPQLFALARQHDLALARSNDDLLDAAELAVRRYGELVQTTRLSDIWVRATKDTQPETHVSDCLRSWLQDQWKVTLSREAETERGKRTDIEVPLSVPGRSSLHVTIEVKKSTRDNLLDGMQTQLRDDYLVAHGHTHGLYVVFWVGPHPKAPSISTAAELQDHLEAQAEDLSNGEIRIKAVVIDCKLPDPSPQKARRSKQTRKKK